MDQVAGIQHGGSCFEDSIPLIAGNGSVWRLRMNRGRFSGEHSGLENLKWFRSHDI